MCVYVLRWFRVAIFVALMTVTINDMAQPTHVEIDINEIQLKEVNVFTSVVGELRRMWRIFPSAAFLHYVGVYHLLILFLVY